jgi:hypothetical protein
MELSPSYRTPRDRAGVRAPEETWEAQLLAELDSLPEGSTRQVNGKLVTVGESYEAASRRRCRPLYVAAAETPTEGRLACHDGQGWFYVPQVFGGGAPEGPGAQGPTDIRGDAAPGEVRR